MPAVLSAAIMKEKPAVRTLLSSKGKNHPTNLLIVEVKKNSNRENGHITVDLINCRLLPVVKATANINTNPVFTLNTDKLRPPPSGLRTEKPSRN